MAGLNQAELYARLDIEHAADFVYFENLAALLECDEELEEGLLYALFAKVDLDNLEELLQNYFTEMGENLPDSAAELFTLLENEQRALVGLLRSGEENKIVQFADELDRFRRWYCQESRVLCTALADRRERTMPLRDALAEIRAARFLGDSEEYDFSACLDYPLEEYLMSFADLLAAEADEILQ